jgi:hypothetical protein
MYLVALLNLLSLIYVIYLIHSFLISYLNFINSIKFFVQIIYLAFYFLSIRLVLQGWGKWLVQGRLNIF